MTPDLNKLLEGYPVSFEIPVQWGDMDAAQHVNNVVYHRWFETARVHFLDVINWKFEFGIGSGPILAEQNCRFKMPVTYPDTITTACRVIPGSIGEFDFQMQHIVVSHQHLRVAAEGTCWVVWYDYVGKRKMAIPGLNLDLGGFR
jgi:acyl-CoA thioester hydrolase